MICVEQKNCKPGDQPADPRSIAELIQLALPNPQCGFLWQGGFPYHYQRSWRVVPTSSRLCNELLWKELLISLARGGRAIQLYHWAGDCQLVGLPPHFPFLPCRQQLALLIPAGAGILGQLSLVYPFPAGVAFD
jgi:hypothetical protein